MGERKALEYVDEELKSLLDRQEKDDE
jgi:hypothetical protein